MSPSGYSRATHARLSQGAFFSAGRILTHVSVR